ncbi:MAG TPA: beta-ketoacyl synthase N-terminal-like domain-containing protein [Thermoanaerobaculia bacterium]|nr:beta-ketoacyl synthase N-terminal-like domain-containing protein [Thermoanaerobaculia bacterium]
MTGRTLFSQGWPEPIVVTGAAAATAGEIAVPAAIADWVERAPFAAVERFLAERAPGAAALVTAMGRLIAQPGMGDLPEPAERGIVIGTWAAALSEVREFMMEVEAVGGSLVNPGLFPFTVINAAAGRAAIEHRCEGPNLTLNNGVTSAFDALAYAADLAASGRSQLVFAGGFEGIGEDLSQAFGRRRGRAVVAAVVALAAAGPAASRGARPLARLLSYSSARDEGSGAEVVRQEVLAAALARAREAAGSDAAVGGAAVPVEVTPAGGGCEPDTILLALLEGVRRAASGHAGQLVPIVAAAPGSPAAAALVLGGPCERSRDGG